MTDAADLARRFLDDLSAGRVDEATCAADMTVWTQSGGATARDRFVGGVAMLAGLFDGGLRYTAEAVFGDGERVAVQASATGRFVDGTPFTQDYAFLMRVRDGRIVELREYNDTARVVADIVPRMRAAMAAR